MLNLLLVSGLVKQICEVRRSNECRDNADREFRGRDDPATDKVSRDQQRAEKSAALCLNPEPEAAGDPYTEDLLEGLHRRGIRRPRSEAASPTLTT